MIETQTGPERVLIVGVQTESYTDDKFDELMDEMVKLTQTAKGQVEGQVRQKLYRLDRRWGVGSGKLEQIQAQVEAAEIDLVIFFNPLSPSVNRSLSQSLSVRVIDRVQLILDIFAMRAKSREGKLQVALAQYQYLLPRIVGQGKTLSRLGAGIGTRGPGESKLETDRRHIRSQIHQIESDLKLLAQHRDRTRSKRQEGSQFNIGLVGYTNAGKSTLLHQLTQTETYVQDQLFATLDPLTRQLTIKGHPAFTLTDTVGFIEELPTELIESFKSTLEEIRYMDLLLHVVDASHPARDMHEETVLRILRELGAQDLPVLTVYNKIDQADANFVPVLQPNVVISAFDSKGLDQLREAIWQLCTQNSQAYHVVLQPEQSDQLAYYRQHTLLQSLEFDEVEQVYIVTGYQNLKHSQLKED